jgi:chromosomal replication initiator protein
MNNKGPSPQLIITKVCEWYNVDEAMVRGNRRFKNVVAARKTAIYLLRKVTSLSLTEIGKEFGRSHTQILKILRENSDILSQNIVDLCAIMWRISDCLDE